MGIADRRLPMVLSHTQHPILSVMEPGHSMQEWQTPALMELKQRLIADPYSLALMQQHLEEAAEDEEGEAPREKIDPVPLDWEEGLEAIALADWQSELETQAIHQLDEVLCRLPPNALVSGKALEEQSTDSEGSISEAESETSHEPGLDLEESDGSSTSREEDEVAERHMVLTAGVNEETEVLNKGQRRRLLDAVHKIAESAKEELAERVPKGPPKPSRPIRRMCGLLKVIEIFTWSCMLS